MYDPERYLESATRELKKYVEANLNTRIYQIVMEFPGADIDALKMPMRKTIIHFEIDDIRDEMPGFSDRPMRLDYNSDETEAEARWAGIHFINFDVGVWASDDSGGTTARLRAKQVLTQMFGYGSSIMSLLKSSDGGDGGVEIIRWTGGTNAQDRVGDIRLYRMMNAELEVRVFSRTPSAMDASDTGPVITDIIQEQHLTILG